MLRYDCPRPSLTSAWDLDFPGALCSIRPCDMQIAPQRRDCIASIERKPFSTCIASSKPSLLAGAPLGATVPCTEVDYGKSKLHALAKNVFHIVYARGFLPVARALHNTMQCASSCCPPSHSSTHCFLMVVLLPVLPRSPSSYSEGFTALANQMAEYGMAATVALPLTHCLCLIYVVLMPLSYVLPSAGCTST